MRMITLFMNEVDIKNLDDRVFAGEAPNRAELMRYILKSWCEMHPVKPVIVQQTPTVPSREPTTTESTTGPTVTMNTDVKLDELDEPVSTPDLDGKVTVVPVHVPADDDDDDDDDE